MLHGIHCIQSCCIKSPAFNRVQFLHAAWNPLHSIMLHCNQCIQSGTIGPRFMESTAFNDTAWNPLADATRSSPSSWNPREAKGSQTGWIAMADGIPLLGNCNGSTSLSDQPKGVLTIP